MLGFERSELTTKNLKDLMSAAKEKHIIICQENPIRINTMDEAEKQSRGSLIAKVPSIDDIHSQKLQPV